jgi:hypothetical protein
MNQLVLLVADRAPAVIAAAGERASYRFLEFFTANIRNPHTRRRGILRLAVLSDFVGRRPLIRRRPGLRLPLDCLQLRLHELGPQPIFSSA